MFLFTSKTRIPADAKPLQEHSDQRNPLPPLGLRLKVGHSTRTIDDAFVEAARDIQTKTALLESRLVAGSEKLYETFSQAYRSYYASENPKDYIAARLDDQASRRPSTATPFSTRSPTSRTASAACATTRTRSGWRG
jgi:[protein-PII] uridylyltransferase